MSESLRLRLRRKVWPALLAIGIMVVVASVFWFGWLPASSGDDGPRAAQDTASASSPLPSPSPSQEIKIPTDATTLLSVSQARTIAGVAKLHWVISGGEEGHTGRLSSETRYANANYYYPDRALRYIEVAIYKGHDEYNNLRDQSFDASTGDHDWVFAGPREHPQLIGVTEAFVANSYAKDGSVIRTLGFTFRGVSMKIEVCNLPTADLFAAAKVVIAKLNELYAVHSV